MENLEIPEEEPVAGPRWLGITAVDLEHVEVDRPVSELRSSDCSDLRDSFSRASEECKAAGDQSGFRVFALLADIAGLHFRPDNTNSPFGPMFVMNDRRSAIPEDFRGDPVEVIASLANMTKASALKARLADVAWLLDRRRVDIGQLAIAAYSETVREIVKGELKSHLDLRNKPSGVHVFDLLQRGLRMASFKSLVPNATDRTEIFDEARAVIAIAEGESDPFAMYRFQQLALNFRIYEPKEVAPKIEKWIADNSGCDGRGRLELLRLAASAYQRAGFADDHNRTKLMAVEQLASMAEASLAERGSAMLAASLFSDAIAELHGLPNARDRRKQLMLRLVEVQADIQDEMRSFSQEMDLREIAEARIAALEGKSLRDMLFQIADMARSPKPEDLRAAEIKNMEKHPLSAIFAASYLDRDGKVIFRAPGADLNGEPSDESLQPGIARAEALRRVVFVGGNLRAALHVLNENYYIADDTLATLLSYSIFVPRDLLLTYSLGFARFLQRDFLAAVYILTPLLEASIKQLLVQNGHQLSTFDNATQTQQDLTISALFDQMRPEIDEVLGTAISTDIENVFLRKPGPSIRHGVAHGLLADGDPYGSDAVYGCWLLFRLCLIPLFRHADSFPSDLR